MAMNIDGIDEGLVLDHVQPGTAIAIYDALDLDKLGSTVAIITFATSKKQGRKDVIKIATPADLDLDVLGYLDPGITVNVIRGGKVVEKVSLKLPEELHEVLRCNNPRCITRDEAGIEHRFTLSDPETATYRCYYCETKAKPRTVAN